MHPLPEIRWRDGGLFVYVGFFIRVFFFWSIVKISDESGPPLLYMNGFVSEKKKKTIIGLLDN